MVENTSSIMVLKVSIAAVVLVFIAFSQTIAQDGKPSADRGELNAPKSESFAATTGLIIPIAQKSSTCNPLSANPTRDCPVLVTVAELKPRSYHSIYDADGESWYEFSSYPRDDAYYLKRLKEGFVPLGPEPYRDKNHGFQSWHPGLIVLRVARESQHWYEVEINEKTRETKFIPKADPTWTKVDWTDVFSIYYGEIFIDPEQTKLLDAPDGKSVECNNGSSKQYFSLLEGDWMRVNDWVRKDWPARPYLDSQCKGWIRWRNGRDILVGSILSGKQVPKAKTTEDSQTAIQPSK